MLGLIGPVTYGFKGKMLAPRQFETCGTECSSLLCSGALFMYTAPAAAAGYTALPEICASLHARALLGMRLNPCNGQKAGSSGLGVQSVSCADKT